MVCGHLQSSERSDWSVCQSIIQQLDPVRPTAAGDAGHCRLATERIVVLKVVIIEAIVDMMLRVAHVLYNQQWKYDEPKRI
jgi:hypothetical protein